MLKKGTMCVPCVPWLMSLVRQSVNCVTQRLVGQAQADEAETEES